MPLRALLLACCLLPAAALAGDERPAVYPAFLPWLPGGELESKFSDPPHFVSLFYARPEDKTCTDLRALFKKEGWTFKEDTVAGVTGRRFAVKKGAASAFFVVKPDHDPKRSLLVVTDIISGK